MSVMSAAQDANAMANHAFCSEQFCALKQGSSQQTEMCNASHTALPRMTSANMQSQNRDDTLCTAYLGEQVQDASLKYGRQQTPDVQTNPSKAHATVHAVLQNGCQTASLCNTG